MKIALCAFLLLLVSGCHGPKLPELLANPAVHKTYVVKRGLEEVYKDINAKGSECKYMSYPRQSNLYTDINEAEIQFMEAQGPYVAYYVKLKQLEESVTRVDVYDAYGYTLFEFCMENIRRGAYGEPGCADI